MNDMTEPAKDPLTKREQFVMAAMQGLSANPAFFAPGNLEAVLAQAGRSQGTPADALALVAVANADAVLALVERGPR